MKKYLFIFSIITLCLAGCSNSQLIQNSIPLNAVPAKYNEINQEPISKLKRSDFLNDTILSNLIDTALVYNSDLQMAFQKIEMSKANLSFFKGRLIPEVNFTTNGGVRRYGLYTMDGAGNSTTDIIPNKRVPVNLPDIYLGFQANWEVDFRGKLNNQKKSAFNKLLASTEGLKYVQTNLVVEIASTYYDLIALDKELELLQETISKQNEALEYVKAQKDAGKTNELAVLQFSGQLYNLTILEKEIQQQITLTENKLNYLAGSFPKTIQRNKETLYQQLTIVNKGLPSDLLNNRPDIKSAEYNLTAANLDLKAAKAAFLPSFNIVSGIGLQAFNSAYLFRTPESMALNMIGGLFAPVVNKSAIKANFKLAKANEIEAMANYQQKILNGFLEVSNELKNLESLQQIDTIANRKNIDNKLAVESALSLYKAARVPYLDVIISQQNALQSNIELINIAKRKKIAALNLYKSIGGGWE